MGISLSVKKQCAEIFLLPPLEQKVLIDEFSNLQDVFNITTIFGLILKNKVAAMGVFPQKKILIVPISLLLLVLEVWHVKPPSWKSWDGNLMCSDLTLSPSFKVRQDKVL